MEQPPIDIEEMHKEREDVQEYIDDGKGEIALWLVYQKIKKNGTKEWEKELLGEEYHGHFFSGERFSFFYLYFPASILSFLLSSFIVLYTYIVKGAEKYVVYFWQGRDSSITEKGASALESIDVANQVGGDARQIRIPQGKETSHFLSLFQDGHYPFLSHIFLKYSHCCRYLSISGGSNIISHLSNCCRNSTAFYVHLGKLKVPTKTPQFYQVREKWSYLVAIEVDDPGSSIFLKRKMLLLGNFDLLLCRNVF